MHTWIALLRGINVVGRNKVPMRELASTFERAGFRSVRTYIQSGNVIFQSADGTARTLSSRISRMILDRFGFAPHVVVISRAQLAEAVRRNPFPECRKNHKALHLFFLTGQPANPDLAELARLDAGNERFALEGDVFYLYTPDGFPDSWVRSRFERCLGVEATGRNWRTVNELLKMIGE